MLDLENQPPICRPWVIFSSVVVGKTYQTQYIRQLLPFTALFRTWKINGLIYWTVCNVNCCDTFAWFFCGMQIESSRSQHYYVPSVNQASKRFSKILGHSSGTSLKNLPAHFMQFLSEKSCSSLSRNRGISRRRKYECKYQALSLGLSDLWKWV